MSSLASIYITAMLEPRALLTQELHCLNHDQYYMT